MRTISGKILIKVEKTEAKKSGGLMIYENEGLEKAVIISVSEDTDSFKAQVKEGEWIYIYKNSGTEITDPETSEIYRVITQSEIVVVL